MKWRKPFTLAAFVIQAVKPFISTGDIDKGKRWTDVLAAS